MTNWPPFEIGTVFDAFAGFFSLELILIGIPCFIAVVVYKIYFKKFFENKLKEHEIK